MKYILFIFIVVLFIGCSSNEVTLMMKDGTRLKSELLSVRDSSVVVQEKGGAPIAIRNEDVHHVFIDGGSPAPSMVGMGLGAAAVGFLFGIYIIPPESNCDVDVCTSTPLPGATLGAIVGAVVGTTAGYFAAPSDKMLFLTNADQHHSLTYYAKYYPEEPDELKKIQ